LNDLLAALFKSGRYKGSQEDFSNLTQDFPSLVPVLIVLLRLLVDPGNCQKNASEAVKNYALTPQAVQEIRGIPC
jgi:hypothetical protein